MDIAYIGPLGRGWERMRTILFRPFDFMKWFVLGFTVFLAELTDLGGWGGSGGSRIRNEMQGDSFGDVCGRCFDSVEGILAGSIAATIVTMIIISAVILWVLFLWLSSRGHFMFLDNLVHNRSRVTAPWSEFSRLGNSLFAWRIVYTLICLLAVGPLVAFGIISVIPFAVDSVPGIVGFASLALLGMVVLIFIIGAAYVDFFLIHIVAPVMYKHRLSSTAAWKKFWPVLKEHMVEFLLYGIFMLILNIALGIAIVVFGMTTCCIGFLILSIPYLGTIILLPVLVAFRGFDLEFLAQFGEDFDLVSDFVNREASPAEPPANAPA